MNREKNTLEHCKTISLASSSLTSRNHSNNQTKKKPEILKLSITFRNSLKKLQSFHSMSQRILINNTRKYNSTPEFCNKHIITSIIFDERKKIVSIFKDYLLWEEISEFFKRYYSFKESRSRIPKISSYYENYTLFCPIYFCLSFSLVKLMTRFIKRKKRHLEFLEDNEDNKQSMIKEIQNGKCSKLIKPSQINTQILLSTIADKKQEDLTITLSKISVNNSKLSFNELINNTLSDDDCDWAKETKVKQPKKFILKKTLNKDNHNPDKLIPLSNKIGGVQIPKIQLQGITKFITESNLNRNKRNAKQTQMIACANSKTMTNNNSITNQIQSHLTTTARFYSNKTKSILNKNLQSRSNKVNFNVNVNLNVNFNINFNNNNNNNNSNINRPSLHNKLVLTTQKTNLRHRMLIAERNNTDNNNGLIIPKIFQNSGATHVKTKRFLDTNITHMKSVLLKKSTKPIILESTVHEQSNAKSRMNTERLRNSNKAHLITYSKTKEAIKLNDIPKIPCANYPLTTRGVDDYKRISGSVISKLMNNTNKAVRTRNNNNNAQSKQKTKLLV